VRLSFRLLAITLILALVAVWAFPAVAASAKRGPISKITFIHYKKGLARPSQPGSGKGGTKCYGFLANGAKWRSAEEYLINPFNLDGMGADFVETSVNAGVSEWESYGGNIFGPGFVDYSVSYNDGSFDGVNSVSFGSYEDNGVIAVTNVWGYFYGAPQTRELLEWDMLFNENFSWGDAGTNPSLMDLRNIATHELGHSAGLADLYETSCQEETMYGYGTEGETKKQNLNTGDIQGIQKLY